MHDRRAGGHRGVRRRVLLIGPSAAAPAAVVRELALSGGEPSAEQAARLRHADRRMQLASRIDLPLILLAGLTVAVGRYP